MAGEPWKDYQTPSAPEGPWTEYQGPTIPRPTQAAPAQPEKSGLARRVLGDSAIDVGKGVIDLGQAAVGLADLGTAGLAGKALEQVGYDPQGANEFLSDYYSPERKQANQAVNDAHGFLPTIKAMVQNPSTIAGSVLESAPSTIGGGVGIARGVAAKALPLAERLAPKLAEYIPTIAGGIGEGAIQAGQSAEQSRATSDDKLLSAKQAVAAVGSGAVDALISSLSGATAQKLGIADIDTLLAGGKVNPNTKPVGILKRALEGIVQEGLLEELPQSAQEQMFQNYATGQPLMAGVPEAAAQGALTGAVQGGATSAVVGGHHVGQDKQQTPTTEQPAAPTQAEPAAAESAPVQGAPPVGAPAPMANPTEPGPLTRIRNKLAEAAPLFPDAQPGDLAHAANTLAGNVDTATGEYVPPTDDAVKASMHQAIEQQVASAGRISRRSLRDVLPDIEAKRFNPLLDQVLAERKQGITSAAYQSTEQSNGPGSLADAAEGGVQGGGLADAAGAGADQLGPPVPADAGLTPAAQADTGNRNDTGGAERALADEAAGARAEGLTRAERINAVRDRIDAAPEQIVRKVGRNELPFKTREAAAAAVARSGHDPSFYTIEPAGDGFVAFRRRASDIEFDAAYPARDMSKNGQNVDTSTPDVSTNAPNLDTSLSPAAQQAPATQETGHELSYDTSDQLQEADIVPPSGEPFTHERAAELQAKRHEGGRVFPVEGGYVVRVPQAAAGPASVGRSAESPASAPQAEASSAAEGQPAKDQSPVAPAQPARSGQPAPRSSQPAPASKPVPTSGSADTAQATATPAETALAPATAATPPVSPQSSPSPVGQASVSPNAAPKGERTAGEGGAQGRFPHIASVAPVSIGPASVRPRPIAEGQHLYRETSLDGLDDLLRHDTAPNAHNLYVTDNPDLALGQGNNKGVQITFRPDSLGGREHQKPGTGAIAGREYQADLSAPRAVQAITMAAKDVNKLRGPTRRALADFDKEDIGGGKVRFTRKGAENLSPRDQIKAQPTKQARPATHTTDSGKQTEAATPAVIAEAAQKAERAPRVTMQQAREDLLHQIDEAIKEAPTEGAAGSMDNPHTSAPRMVQRVKTWEVSIDRTLDNGLKTPTLKIEASLSGNSFDIKHSYKTLATEESLLAARLTAGRLLMGAEWKAGGAAGSWSFKEVAPTSMVTLDVKGDGTFKVRNTKERLQQFRKQVEQQFKNRPDSSIRDLPDYTPTPRLTVPANERAKIMAEAETVDELPSQPATPSKEQGGAQAASGSETPVELTKDTAHWERVISGLTEPNPHQRKLIDAAREVMADKSLYRSGTLYNDVFDKAMRQRVTFSEAAKAEKMNVERGATGYEMYLARKAVEGEQERTANAEASKGFTVGAKVGTFRTVANGKMRTFTGGVVEKVTANSVTLAATMKGARKGSHLVTMSAAGLRNVLDRHAAEQEAKKPQPGQPTKQAQPATPSKEQGSGKIRAGEVGGKMASGEVVLTASGRKTSPFPNVATDTKGKTTNTLKRVDAWLMQNALDEARARGDNFNAHQFEANLSKPSQADKDSAEEYLFGEQPAVMRSALRPLTASKQGKSTGETAKPEPMGLAAEREAKVATQSASAPAALDQRVRSLAQGLQRIGWELTNVEVDVGAETARIELRNGPRRVMFDARNGRASVERDLIEEEQVTIGRKGDRNVVRRLKPVFMGRNRFSGLRAGLRGLSNYLVDNASVAITQEQARDLFRPLLGGEPVRAALEHGNVIEGEAKRVETSQPTAGTEAAAEIPAWHTPLPTEGLPITAAQTKRRGYEGVPHAVAEDAYNAITQQQRVNGEGLYAYFMPAADGRNGIARLVPDDQKPGAPWKLLNGQIVRFGMMTKEQVVARLAEWLRSAPIIGEASQATPSPQAAAQTSGKPDPGRYVQPKGNGSREQQMELANRGSTIATLKMLNARVAKINPDAAYSDHEIENAANLDALRNYLSEQQKPAAAEQVAASRQPTIPGVEGRDYVLIRTAQNTEIAAHRAGANPETVPGDRWYSDRGAMDGEPIAYLDGDAEDGATAAIVLEHVPDDPRFVFYRAAAPDGATIGDFSTAAEAARAAEAHVDAAARTPAQAESTKAEAAGQPTEEKGKTESRPNRDAGVAPDLLAARDAAEVRAKAASAALDAFPKGNMGLTPDAVKATSEWQAANRESNKALNALRAANAAVVQARKATPAKAESATPEAGTLDGQRDLMKRLADGSVSLDEYRAGFAALRANRERILAELGKLQIDKLLPLNGMNARRSDGKARLVRGAYDNLITDYNLAGSFTWSMGQKIEDVMAAKVAATTEQDLRDYADRVAASRAERKARQESVTAGLQNPKTIEDFTRIARSLGSEDKLSPEHRATFDALRTEARREQRETEAKRNAIVRQVDTGGTGMELVETKHTQKGHDLFVVKMAERVDGDTYKALNVAAKRLGGHYSSYRGNGAVPGFTFTTRAAAEQFMAVREGNVDASGAQQARAAAKAERRAETLAEKADALREKAQESLGRERKDNTARRAAQAASAEAEARKQLALADTMTRIAKAIDDGKAKLLAFVRHKSQVELLDHLLRMAHDDHLRAQGVNWEKAKEAPLSANDITNAALPKFSLSRGDAITVARRLVAARGGKQLGLSLAKLVDYGEDYGKAVQEAPHRFVLGVQRSDGSAAAVFTTKRDADAVLARSPEKAKGTVVKLPDGFIGDRSKKWAVVLAPDIAIERKLWAPDYDKKVNLSAEAAQKIVDVLGTGFGSAVPYWFESRLEQRKALARMGIETGYELREALREYLALRADPAEEDRVRKLERALAGNKSVGVDFFPTPPAVVQRIVEQADIGPGMRVLEPSAGKGDIAEALRDAAEGVTVDTVEMSHTLREILEAKGFDPQSGDFLEHQSEPVYDRIVMNPPFGNDNGASHVQHAYEMLKPGGRLVAVMGMGQRGKESFEKWLDKVGGLAEPLPEGSFKSSFRPTGVATQVVVIDKPEGTTQAAPAREAEVALENTDQPEVDENAQPTPEEQAVFDRAQNDSLARENAAKLSRAQGEADAESRGFKDAVARVLGDQASRVEYVRDYAGLPEALRDGVMQRNAERAQGGKAVVTGALYDPATQRVFIVTSVVKTPGRAVWNALHEIAGHDGLRKLLGTKLDRALEIALQNSTVNALAKAIAHDRGIDMKSQSGRLLAAEEALAELAAAVGSGDFAHIQARYGVEVGEGIQRNSLGRAIDNFLSRLKELLNDLFGRPEFTDQDVRSLLEHAWQAAQSEGTTSGDLAEQTVYHGTPHRGIEKFSLQKIGTGEGAQAYGWGMYFARERDIAEHYRQMLTQGQLVIDGKPFEPSNYSINEMVAKHKGDDASLSRRLREYARINGGNPYAGNEDALKVADAIDRGALAKAAPGQTYQVNVPDDSDLLHWDEPLSAQPQKVRDALQSAGLVDFANNRLGDGLGAVPKFTNVGSFTGEKLYRRLVEREFEKQSEVTSAARKRSEQAASHALNEAGIPGLRYLDGNSRNKGEGTHNYVIWDENAIGQPLGLLESTEPLTRRASETPADVLADVEAVMTAGQDKTLLQQAKDKLASLVPSKVKNETRHLWLAGLSTDMLAELGSDHNANTQHYAHFLKAMNADRNELQQQGDALAEDVRQWGSKHPQEAKDLFKLMHQATIDGVDPAKEYQPLQFRYSGKLVEVTPKNIKEALAAIRQQMRERSGDSKKDMLDEAKKLRAMKNAEPRRKAQYPTLKAKWDALTPEAQQFYTQMRDMYQARSQMVEDGLVARIEDTDAPENQKRKLITVIRQQFETQRLQGVYFPLQRFGQYFVAAEKGDSSTFLMFESQGKLEAGVKMLKDRGFTITAQGLKSQGKAADAPSGTFVAEVIDMLKKAHVSEKTQDDIYQAYLQALPELSMRKHAIHRKAVPGFDPDAVRGFAFNMLHGAHQIARLRYAHKLANTITLLRQQQDAARKNPEADTRKIVAFDGILNELDKRHQWIMNPTDSKATGLISSAGFIYYLGLTPAAAMVNLTQTALLTFPYLAARHGPVRAMNHLLTGMRDTARTFGHIQKVLTDPDELAMHAELIRRGLLDKTQAFNLAGIAEGGLAGHNPQWAKAMSIIGMPFHKAEVFNREASGIAAYRLARQDGATHDAAIDAAARAINDTHFDYTNQNRARVFQSGTAKALLMFRQYSLNMTWHLGRMLWQATKNADPEVKKIARRNLAGVLGMSAIFSGTLGLPLMSVTFGVLNAIAASFGNPDEPWDAETEFTKFLDDMFGKGVGEVLANGPVNTLTGADIASRVSLSQLWFRDADRELDGQGAYYNLLEQAAGPMGGVLKNTLVGKQLIDQGHTMRGIETMLPKALKDAVKAQRYATEGVNNLRGDPILPDVSLRQTLMQLAGFTPDQVAQQYDVNRDLKNYEQAILLRRSSLIDAFALALRTEDDEGRAHVLEQIRRFNQTNPEIAITTKGLRSSIGTRARYSHDAENGIVLNRKLAAKVHAEVGD